MSIIKQDRQKLLLDLYNQGKNTREIAKEARMSFRDIGSILNKADERREQYNNIENKKQQQEQEQLQQLSLSTQAYKLFSERKTPIEVAVALNVREAEVTRFYKEYLKLDQMHDLNMAYEELKGDITPFLKLYRSARAAGMSEEHVVHLLRIANDDDNLPAVEHRYNGLKQEVNSLEIIKLNSNKDLQDLRKQILTLRKTLGFCNLTYKQQSEKIAGLHAKRIALEDLVRRFENNNEEYLKIDQTVKDRVSSILSDGKGILRIAFYSLIESVRNEPVKYSSLICYNGIYGLQQQHTSSQNYYVEHCTTMLIEEAERLYNKLVKEITKGITYDNS
jgi:hypothetical protein